LDSVECFPGNDGLVIGAVDLALMGDFPDVATVLEKIS
jgi:hypothetical protein